MATALGGMAEGISKGIGNAIAILQARAALAHQDMLQKEHELTMKKLGLEYKTLEEANEPLKLDDILNKAFDDPTVANYVKQLAIRSGVVNTDAEGNLFIKRRDANELSKALYNPVIAKDIADKRLDAINQQLNNPDLDAATKQNLLTTKRKLEAAAGVLLPHAIETGAVTPEGKPAKSTEIINLITGEKIAHGEPIQLFRPEVTAITEGGEKPGTKRNVLVDETGKPIYTGQPVPDISGKHIGWIGDASGGKRAAIIDTYTNTVTPIGSPVEVPEKWQIKQITSQDINAQPQFIAFNPNNPQQSYELKIPGINAPLPLPSVKNYADFKAKLPQIPKERLPDFISQYPTYAAAYDAEIKQTLRDQNKKVQSGGGMIGGGKKPWLDFNPYVPPF